MLLRTAIAMTHPHFSQLIALDHHHRLTADATRRRLIAIATCCRASGVGAAVMALRSRLTPKRLVACCA